MRLVDGKIRWAPRVEPSLIARLYESDAKGFRDGDLAGEVGCAIVARVEDVMAATASVCDDKAKCPVCKKTISFVSPKDGGWDTVILDCICGYKAKLREYRESFQGKKLSAVGAFPALGKFMEQYAKAKDYSGKMLAIDLLIHTFHYELQGEQITRSVATNIIYARRERDLIVFLDKLACSDISTQGLSSNKNRFFANIHKSGIASYLIGEK